MNINDLTIGQAKELAAMLGAAPAPTPAPAPATLNSMIGRQVIVRTYSAGVWYGTLAEKAGNEVIVKNARRMWRWWAAESISLSGVALHGIKTEKSTIAPPVDAVWMEAIEIIPCTEKAIQSIGEAPYAKAE